MPVSGSKSQVETEREERVRACVRESEEGRERVGGDLQWA